MAEGHLFSGLPNVPNAHLANNPRRSCEFLFSAAQIEAVTPVVYLASGSGTTPAGEVASKGTSS
jgi:hypothetical protein